MLASMIFRKEPFFHGHDNYDQVKNGRRRRRRDAGSVRWLQLWRLFLAKRLTTGSTDVKGEFKGLSSAHSLVHRAARAHCKGSGHGGPVRLHRQVQHRAGPALQRHPGKVPPPFYGSALKAASADAAFSAPPPDTPVNGGSASSTARTSTWSARRLWTSWTNCCATITKPASRPGRPWITPTSVRSVPLERSVFRLQL